MDNQNNNINNTINELSSNMPRQTISVEGTPSPDQNISNSVSTSENAYISSQVQSSNFTYPQNQTTNMQTQTMTNSNTSRNNIQNNINNPLLNSDDLIRAFIGPNYEKIIKRSFNFSAFFFTSFYYFYRKMNLYAIMIIILQVVVSYFLYNIPYAILIVNLLCGLITNKLYARFAVKKVSKTLVNNPDKSLVEVKGMCYVIGGRSIGRIFILLFLIAPYLSIIILVILLKSSLASFEEFMKNIDLKLPEIRFPNIKFGNKFDESINTDKTNKVLDYFKIDNPGEF